MTVPAGSSWSWIQSTDFPSGARDGSSAAGWPQTIVASAGSKPALRLVDRARDAVEARRDVDDRAAPEPLGLRPLPARRLVEREMDLHLGAAVAESRRSLGDAGGHVGVAEQRAVKLGRRHVRDDGAGGRDDLSVCESHSGRPAVRDDDPLDVGVESHLAARVRDDPCERIDEADAAADGHRHAAELERGADHLGHEAGRRLIRAEPRVEHPRREDAVGRLRLRTSRRPSRGS